MTTKHTQGRRQRAEHEPIGVLEEAQPPHALLRPCSSQATGMLHGVTTCETADAALHCEGAHRGKQVAKMTAHSCRRLLSRHVLALLTSSACTSPWPCGLVCTRKGSFGSSARCASPSDRQGTCNMRCI